MTDTSHTKTPEQKPRRRWLRRAAIATVIGGIAAGIGFRAFGQGEGFGCWPRGGLMAGAFDPARLDDHIDRMLGHLYVEIDATEEQKRRLAPILKQAAHDVIPLHQKMRGARRQAMELLASENIDRAAIEALRVEQLQTAEQASRRIAQALADAAEVLTPAQRQQLAARVGRRLWG